MTATSGKQFSVGLRYGVAFALNTSGSVAATSTAAYEGLEFKGAKAFDLTEPEARRISHMGDDRLMAVDYLPPVEGVSGEIRTGMGNFELDAMLSGVNSYTVGEAQMISRATDMQGFEPQVALLLYQQSLDSANKARRWRFAILPSTRVISMPPGMTENAAEHRYMLAPSPVSQHLWGVALTDGVEGATEQQWVEGMTEYPPRVVAFLCDGTEDEYLLPTAHPAQSTAKMVVTKNGAVQTTGLTKTTTKLTFTSAPTANDLVICFYEAAV